MAQRKRNIEFARPEEPSFLKKLRGQVGLQKDDIDTVDTKKEKLENKDLSYRDEEPVYVITDQSDVTEQELENFKEKVKQEKDFEKDDELHSKRIIFKKPNKGVEGANLETFQSTKKSDKGSDAQFNSNNRKETEGKQVKNSRLLSFNDDQDENESD